MPDITCRQFTLRNDDLANVEAARADLKELFCDDPKGALVSDFDDVTDLFRRSLQTGLAVRFHDDGFPGLTVVWHWVGEGVSLSYILRGGRVHQINLMLAGLNRDDEIKAICHFRSLLALGLGDDDWEAIFDASRPTLVTFTSIPSDAEDGSYLLGLILYAAFSEVLALS